MAGTSPGLSRRDFFKASAGGGFALGGLLSLGLDLQAAQAEASGFKIADAKEVPSVCPYCAVGCGQLVSVRKDEDGFRRIVNIEGNPASPINQGTLCPKGAATYQLAVNPLRVTKVWHRKPGAADWDKDVPLADAMKRIAELVKKTRDDNFVTELKDDKGEVVKDYRDPPKPWVVNHTMAIASLGGATMDNEWNYIQAKLMRALGVVFIENQARI